MLRDFSIGYDDADSEPDDATVQEALPKDNPKAAHPNNQTHPYIGNPTGPNKQNPAPVLLESTAGEKRPSRLRTSPTFLRMGT